ncbi:DUF6485 family protein [Candidatus Omnitrophota bacterium]
MTTNCVNKSKNMEYCNCSYEGCGRKGICCECVHYHRQKGAIPACFFPESAEKTFNRSIEYFIEVYQKEKHL